MKKTLLLMLFVMALNIAGFSQVTTSGISGKVLSADNSSLPGATIVAIHVPSGTQYAAVTNDQGRFVLQGMRTGGPYNVQVSFIGYQSTSYSDLTLTLGDNYEFNVTLAEKSVAIEDVVVYAVKTVEKTGTSTNISSRQLQTMPTISRSINDFTRISPYAGSGNSFAGRDGRFNNITIDGAAFNNNFGLSSKNLPGGDAQPISLDALEEISVNVTPYDIRQSNFTGASINAVTKSGNNEIKGTVYTFIRPKSFTGEKVGDITVENARERVANTYGLSIGGPIIKNKLFFFVNGELESQEFSGIEWKPSTNGTGDAATKTSRTTETDLLAMKNYLSSTHGYDAGSYKDFGNFESKNHKIMARLDWNISNKHKFTLRFNDVKSSNDAEVSFNSAPNPRSSGRYSVDAISFSNSNYSFTNYVRSLTGELNSNFSSTLNNKLLASYTHIQDTRSSGSSPFPFVDIYKDGAQYMSFGYELFSYNNDVVNNTFNITNNLTFNLGNHQLLAGISFDRLYFLNSYLRYAQSYYRYASMDDFFNDARPNAFGLTYGYNGNDAPGSELTFGLGAAYIQDVFHVNSKLKLTAGLRVERPFYFDNMVGNAAIAALDFNREKVDISKWPNPKISVSPRFGFNFNVIDDRSVVVRGGTGLFTGFLPFVWFTNQPTNSGVIQNVVELVGNNVPVDLRFEKNYRDQMTNYPASFPSQPNVSVPGTINVVDPDFKLPKIWRSSLGVDFELPMDFLFTMEGMYSKDLNAIVQRNINEVVPTNVLSGPDKRQTWRNLATGVTTNKIYGTNPTNISNAMVLDNTSKGYQYSLTAQLTKKLSHGIAGSLAYTYSMAKDVTSNPGSSANSAWSSNSAINSLNDPGLSYSGFNVPHRVVGSASYRIEYAKFLATTISVFYTGRNQGRSSYTYSNDMNGDGNSSDLIYIPKNAGEIKFADYTSNSVTITAAEQQAAFWEFVEGNEYLSKQKGKYAERFGHVQPWLNRFDVKISQDVMANIGANRKGTLQVGLDILNAGNLINSDWGVYQTNGLMNYDNIRPLTYVRLEGGEPVYRLNVSSASINEFKDKSKYVGDVSTSSTWGMLFSLRLIF